jgi:SAM-dependent methyltransferase
MLFANMLCDLSVSAVKSPNPMRVASLLPAALKRPLRDARNIIADMACRGSGRYCPVCEKSSRKFGKAGVVSRADARCIHCGSLERHRLTWLYFTRRTNLFHRNIGKMLHVAPEPVFENLLKRHLGQAYLTADLHNPRAMIKMDITDIRYPNEAFDVIYCSHVLEHVPDDKKALREFYRVLKRGSWAVLLVPVDADKTFEDLSITDPEERLRLFGNRGHVRRYGPDFADRLREAGFKVTVAAPADFLTGAEIERMGITREAGEIFYCEKS